MRGFRATWAAAWLLCGLAGAAPTELPAELDPGRFEADYRALTAADHRLAGTAEAARAGEHIEAELRKLPGRLFTQRFTLPQQTVGACELRTAEGTVPLLPLAANGLQPSVTPEKGLEGPVLYVGKGTYADIDGKDLDGALVAVDFDGDGQGGVGMVALFRMGAQAVIFVGDGDDDRLDVANVRTTASVDLPRFYVSRAAAEGRGLFRAPKGVLVSRVRWEKRQGRNLFLWIPGKDPVFKSEARPEFVILSAYYDTGGIVPQLSKGQEAAANCAALLETARRLAAQPPRRSVLVAFFDNHANFLQGGREFYKAYRRGMPEYIDDPLTIRRQYARKERDYLKAMIAFLGRPGFFELKKGEPFEKLLSGSAQHGELASALPKELLERPCAYYFEKAIVLLRDESRFRYDDYQERLSDARLHVRRLKEEKAKIAEMTPRLAQMGRWAEAAYARLPAGVREKAERLTEGEQRKVRRDLSATMRRFAADSEAETARLRGREPEEQAGLLRLLPERAAETEKVLAARAAEIDREVAKTEAGVKEMGADQRQWQWVRECIRDEKAPAQKAQGHFQAGMDAVVTRMKNRLGELEEVIQSLDDGIALAGPLVQGTPTFHVAYRLTAGTDRWFLLPHGTKHKKLYSELVDRAGKGLAPAQSEALRFVWQSKNAWESDAASEGAYSLWPTYEESRFADVFEVPCGDVMTEQDRAPYALMPNAPLKAEDMDGIRRKASSFLYFLSFVTGADWASAPDRVLTQRQFYMDDYEWKDDEAFGHQVKSFAYGQTSANTPEPNVLVHLEDTGAVYPDFYELADGNGCFSMTTVMTLKLSGLRVQAGKFTDEGRLKAITTQVPGGGRGSVQAGWSKGGWYSPKSYIGFYAVLNMFSGPHGQILGGTLPYGDVFQPNAFQVLNGLSNSTYPRLHFRFDEKVGAGVYYVERPLGVKLIYMDPKDQDSVALYLRSVPKEPSGVGYGPGSEAPDEHGRHTLDLRTALAPDLYALNEDRLDALRRKNIVLNFYEDLHMRAQNLLDEYYEAAETDRHEEAETRAATVAALERRVYSPVIATTKDMVTAVTILLLLTIPFAFSTQSLVLSTYSVYRKIGGFILIFALSFLVLYLTHPAFSFAPTPLIIFEAFFVLVMSAVVIWIITDRFTYEVKKLQGLATAAHTFERSFFGNMGAAVSLAISTMRRRPVRTALTVVTALLLTFTILSFVAFQTEKGINKFYLGSRGDDPYSRLLVRRKVWKNIAESVLHETRSYLGKGYGVHGRYWKVRELSPTMLEEDLHIPIRREAGGFSVAGALMTVDRLEMEHVPGIREILPGRLEEFTAGKGVYLPAGIAGELKAKVGDKLKLQGEDVEFLGTFDARRLLTAREIDGSPLLPVNFAMTKVAIGKFESKGSASTGDPQADLEAELAQLESEALEPVSPDAVVLVATVLARRLGMTLKGVVIYPEQKGQDLDKLGEELAVLNEDGVYLNKGGETHLYHYGDRFGVAGALDVVIPLVLGGLIVFSTMLGSVIDREREIYTFSALGLAPRNIAMLFFVEAGIYSVIGGFGGYLLSQVVTRVLEVLATYGIFKAPEMNYSSSTAIYTILIVMATVIVSTIYPAMQAAEKATAETAKRWRIPPPQGDDLAFDFPFTISRYDITGIICFIREHFVNHADRTVGKFAAGDVDVFREPEHGMVALEATVWLQPFDQGISQRFQISARPSDIEEVCEVHIEIRRLSGPPVAWERSNRLFLEDLRSQFLLWRTLDDDVREHYLSLADELEETLAGVA